jgi:cytochrome b involved in lipid metabolism|tara:strand:+ start:202 stop:429 length:228 start_codon:yes stop_codon:yes gene_type:complete
MLVYTVDDVAAHCTGDDCWIIVDDGIYDVTAFVDVHPGGRSALLRMRTPPNARSAMESVGHSKRAYALLDSYRIG